MCNDSEQSGFISNIKLTIIIKALLEREVTAGQIRKHVQFKVK